MTNACKIGFGSYWAESVSAEKIGGSLPQYHVDKQFADRRYKVQSARTYFYLNEATCERNMEVFQNCLDAVAGKIYKTILFKIKKIFYVSKRFNYRSIIFC